MHVPNLVSALQRRPRLVIVGVTATVLVLVAALQGVNLWCSGKLRLQAGYEAHVAKPVEPDELVSVVASALVARADLAPPLRPGNL